jgi:flagellar motor switch protein FliG
MGYRNSYSTISTAQSGLLLIEILNRVDRNSKDQIIRELKDKDPELAEKLKKRLTTLNKLYRKIWERLKVKNRPAVSVKTKV